MFIVVMKMFHDVKFDFKNKNVLIIGGSKGIGKAVLSAFMEYGSNVYYVSRTKIPEKNDAIHIPADLHDSNEIDAIFRFLDNKRISIDILINSAAINYCKSIDAIDVAEWDEVLNVNLRSVFQISKNIVNIMKKNRYGKIVTISSIAARHRSPVSGVHYVASKTALIGFTKQLAFEVAKFGINVNVVCPSQTKTEMLANSMNEQELVELSDKIPMNRLAEVHDQVGPILFLCSELSSYITGAVIDVNGGQV